MPQRSRGQRGTPDPGSRNREKVAPRPGRALRIYPPRAGPSPPAGASDPPQRGVTATEQVTLPGAATLPACAPFEVAARLGRSEQPAVAATETAGRWRPYDRDIVQHGQLQRIGNSLRASELPRARFTRT